MNRLLVFSVLASAVVHAAVPTVSVPDFKYDPTNGLATISYTLSGASAIVTLDVRTNGVSIGAANYLGAWGDVWKRVSAGTDTKRILWRPRGSWPGTLLSAANAGSLTVCLDARPLTDPPRYMVASLSTPSNVFFYTEEALLPGGKGVHDIRYKVDWLVLRRIPAAGVAWRMGMPVVDPATRNRDHAHTVTLSQDYYMAVFETTCDQLYQLTSSFTTWGTDRAYVPNSDFQAVANASYDDLRGTDFDFPKNGHEVAPASIFGLMRARTGIAFDLPTDAQWEYACRAGTGSRFNNGEDSTNNLHEIAWTIGTVDRAATTARPLPVGLLKPNAWGLYDMHGNVWERVLDWCVNNLTEDALDPTGPNDNPGTGKIRRGSSYGQGGTWQDFVRSSHRNWGARNEKQGFRICAPIVIPALAE